MAVRVPEPVSVPEPPPQPPIVQRSDLVKGYEYSKGQYVTASKEDLEKITPETAREMQILEFVRLAEVDPIYFETSYYVTPERAAGERAYALLFEALRRSGYVALAQFAMHNREHVVVIRSGRTGIILHTMFYETEIRRDDEYRTDTSNVAERELELALMLVHNLAAPFEPAKYRDTYKEKLEALLAAKVEGKAPVEEPKPVAKPATDILAALERSLALARKPAASESAPATKRKRAK
jgi:DNA end-binding protein Ku